MTSLKLGDIEVFPVHDATAFVDRHLAFPGQTDEQWAPHLDLVDAEGRMAFEIGSFLVVTPDRVVLVDAGMGPVTSPGGMVTGGALLDSLHDLGYRPGDVTDVIFGHLHHDHVGWASDAEGRATFPNATYRCEERDWQHFVPADELTTQFLQPVADRFELFAGDGPLLPGIDAMVIPGHTPGNTVLVLSSGLERAMLLGDTVHCPIELVDEEWSGMGDVDPVMARQARNALARELEGQDVPLAAAHFPGMRFGRLLSGSGTRRWTFG